PPPGGDHGLFDRGGHLPAAADRRLAPPRAGLDGAAVVQLVDDEARARDVVADLDLIAGKHAVEHAVARIVDVGLNRARAVHDDRHAARGDRYHPAAHLLIE